MLTLTGRMPLARTQHLKLVDANAVAATPARAAGAITMDDKANKAKRAETFCDRS